MTAMRKSSVKQLRAQCAQLQHAIHDAEQLAFDAWLREDPELEAVRRSHLENLRHELHAV